MTKPKVIIIEGCDKTGKSTLAYNLVENFGYTKYIHLGKPDEGQDMWDYHYKHIQTIFQHNEYTVIDRFHISNLVYGRLLNHEHLDPVQVHKLETLLNDIGTGIIYCWRDEAKIKDDFFYQKEDLIKPEQISFINKEYWFQLHETNVPYLTYNFEVDGPMTKRFLKDLLKPTYD